MAIFENELDGNVSDRNYTPKVDIPLGSTRDALTDINVNLGGFENFGDNTPSYQGMDFDQLSKLGLAAKGDPFSFGSTFSMVSKSELLANQRYPLYERGVDLENIYGLQQSGLAQLGNGLVKMGALALGSFGQSFATIPNTISAVKNLDVSELSGEGGYESTIDSWTKNLEDYFPNYVTRYEQERGLATAIPFTYGSANFWGDKILKNTGFMVGAIGGAIVQDAAIGFVTGGVGELPLVAAQLGKASLYLNKLFTGAGKVDRVLDLAKAAGKSEKTLLNIQKLGQLAAADRLNTGFRYGMSIYGSARTEAAIESRESYRTIKEQLTEQYKLDNYGEEPTSEALQQIEEYATDAMNTRFGINMALLTVSNAVQFDNLFKTFISAQKGLTSSRGIAFQDAGKIGLKEGSLDVFEKKLPATLGAKVWDSVKPRALNIFTEGVYEEGGQFATQVGVEDYYTRKYKAQGKESWDFVEEAMTSTTKGMAEQFGSSEGIESMIVGGITAALTGEAMSIIDKVKGQGKNKRLDSAINIMNQYGMTGILSEKYQDTSTSLEIAKQMQDAVKSNNIFKYKNLKSDMLFNFVKSRLSIGMHDVTLEQLQMLKELPKEEFEKTFGMDFSTSNKQTVNQYVDSIILKADSIKDTVEGVNSLFKNPFKRIMDPKTDDERLELRKHAIFESWKTDLSQLSVVQEDVDTRLFDIQNDITNESPSVTIDLLGMLSTEKGLKELNDVYEKKANGLSESLSTIDASKRSAVRDEIKKLRTLSEKISMALSSGGVDPTLFNTLLNFEINGQDFSTPNSIGMDKYQKLSEYSQDINKLKDRKEKSEKSFDYLSSEKGFDSYFEQAENQKKQEEEEVKNEISKPETTQYEFVNKFNKPEIPVEGREYQLENAAIAKVRKAGAQYKVTSPTGEVTYYDTREEAKQVADDMNVDFSELTKVKILAFNSDGTIKVEDLVGNIQNISPKLLQGYEKLQTEEEKLAKDKETLDKELEKLAPTGGSVQSVSPTPGEFIGTDNKAKDVDIVFLATTSPSEDTGGNEVNNLSHIKRARTFLNNFKFFKNRNKIKVIIVTPSNVKELGLEGLIQLSYNKNITDELTKDETDVETGFMAQVFIVQTPQGNFFVNEKGEKLSKVGEVSDTILDNIVFQTMTSASLTTEGGYTKIRKGQEEQADVALEAYKIFRQQLFGQTGYTPYPFAISRGIPNQNVVNGVYEDNHMSDILGPNADKIIAEHNGLIEVVTTGQVENNAELLSFPVGTTLIRFGDLLDYANNKVLTNKQANNVFHVINAMAKDLIAKSDTAKAGKPDYGYITFLKNVLYFKFKGNPTTPSQISIDTATMNFRVGDKSFPFSEIESRKQEVMDALQKAFISVNNKTLTDLGTSKEFTEYVADKDGNLTKVVWPNYQSFLLADKYPEKSIYQGAKRSVEETPLITHTAKPTDNQNSYKQKYAYITATDILPYDKVPVKEAKPAPVQDKNKIGKYDVNTSTPQIFPINSGDILFTATLSPEGEVGVTVQSNQTLSDLSTDPVKIKTIDTSLKANLSPEEIVEFDKKSNEEKAKLFFVAAITQSLNKTLAEQQSIPEEVYEAFTEEAEESRQQSIELEQQELENKPVQDAPYDPSKIIKEDGGPEFRMFGEDSYDRITNAELEIFKQWHAENVPFIPFEILENIIKRGDVTAWGVFENGVAKFVRGGLRGTEYHEIFEAIYADFLTETQKNDLLNEFKNKKGEFTDRQSGKKIAYSDATDKQAKERIADDFADFRLGKLPARSLGESVRNLFKRIMDFFKSFVSKPSLKNELFKAIDSGKFKQTKLSERAKTLAPEYRAIEGLTEEQTNNFINDMVFQVSRIIFREGNKDALFNPEQLTGNEVFDKVRENYVSKGKVAALGEKRYNELVKRTINSIRTRGISFNADEVVTINDENANSRDYAPEPFSVDWKKHSTGALKFLLSTLAERKALNQTNVEKLTPLKPAAYNLSNEGFKILNFNRVFATLLDRLHNTNSPEEFTKKFIQLAKEDSNYLSLFVSLGGNTVTHEFDFPNFGESDWKLFIQFFNTFSRQKPEALIQYTSEEGDVYTGPANLFTTIKQTADGWIDNMRTIGKGEGGLISYDKKVYKINTVKIKEFSVKKSTDQLKFLNALGIEFDQGTYNALSNKEAIIKGKKTTELKEFTDAVGKIYTQLGKNNDLMTFDAKRLAINGPLRTLAELYTRVNNPNQDSTYFGVEGQRIGSFSENNAPSYFENTFNESETLTELLEKMPQLNDVYSRGSEVLKLGGLFFDKDGNRIAEIKVGYIQGSKNLLDGSAKTTAKLSKGQRFIQEINQNINGNYYVLIPGDSSTEWMMNLGNVISMEDVIEGKHWTKVYNIYNNYLNDEINLALADRKQNIYQRARSQELRIMKDVLPEKIVEKIESMIEDGKTYDDVQKYISDNRGDINSSIKDFVDNMSKETIDILLNSNQIRMIGENEYVISKFDTEFLKKHNLSGTITFDELMNVINFVNINYQINNQEYHKILFGDPYQFKTEKGKLDETKRIKSFLSGRRRTFNMTEYNNFLKDQYNSVNGITLDDKTPGHHNYKSYTNTVTFNTVEIVGSIATLPNIPKEIKDEFAKTDESDAMSWLMDNTHKEIALKEGQWSDQAEAFHQWQMAYTRRAFDKKKIKEYTSEKLRELDNKLLASHMPKHTLAVRKPIVSGNKFNKTEIDLVLDKTSQIPLYYNMVEGTNLEEMYIQMFNQNVGYSIVITGRKVGAEGLHNVYNTDGTFNTEKFNNVTEVPWIAYGTQVETMSEGDKTQTRGSQLTKLASSDLYENGEAITEEGKKAYERNNKALNMLNENAYNELLKRLGVVDLGDTFALENKQIISETLMYEMMRRELSENAIDTIQLNEDGEFIMPFEASPSYTQIKSILYSMVNKALISPAMSGAPHVQVPVTMFEKATEGRSLAMKTDTGWVKISKAKYKTLTEEEKKNVMLTDDTLKFYEDENGKRYCEVMLPHWFKGKFGKMTDEQILAYLKTDEGVKILTGIGFRIPTQALSSVEVFRVKGFLPQYMGYTVVVPSEITKKAGSDFDIDKLNIYLKSVYTDRNGNVKLIKWQGSEQATKDFFAKVYDESTERKALKKAELIEAIDVLIYGLEDTKGLLNKYGEYILSIQDKYEDPFMFRAEMEKELDRLTDANLNAEMRTAEVNSMYKKSLENEYYESLEELLTLPENFIKLITPVDDAGLEKISEVLDDAREYNEADVKGRLINRNFMTSMRHAFITGKRWVGIAAVNITNLSLRQKSKVYLDPSKISSLSAQERKFVQDLSIVLPHNTIDVNGQQYVSLSGTKTSDGKQLISQRLSGYATAFVDIANKPFITKIIKSDTVVSTFMFLEAIGAGNTGIYFLNQPIIEKYLEYLDGIGSKSVMGKDNLAYIRDMFPTTQETIRQTKISVEGLLGNISQYAEKQRFDAIKNAEQQLILNEFIKYKILADQLFSYTQATNYDTTKFGSSDLYFKKQLGTIAASNFNLISNVDDVLKNTFIGKQAELLGKSFNAFGAIMKTEDPKIKAYMIDTLKKYASRKYMSADDYMKIANLINNSFIDYIIQNDRTYYNLIKPELVDSATAVVTKLEQAKQKYPSIKLLQDLVPVLSNREDGAKSIQLKANVKDAYNENLYVGMMRELRDIPELNSLYNDIVNVAILQGTSQSAISIRNIIPVEDYAAKIKPIIDNLQPNVNLESFSNGMFERNNFSNKDVFMEYTPFANPSKLERDEVLNPNTGETEVLYYIPAFKQTKGSQKGLLVLNDTYNSFQLGSDFIRVPKVITARDGNKVNIATRSEVTAKDYAVMKQKGSQDLYDAYYYKKVYTTNVDEYGNLIPLIIPTVDKKTGNILYNYYYKQINVYGDGNRAVEYNTNFTPSVIDNGSITIQEELSDDEIVSQFAPQIAEEVVSLPEVIKEEIIIIKEENVEETTSETVEYTPEEQLQFEIADVNRRIAELEQIQEDLTENNLETIVLNNLPKITPVSAAKETGGKVGSKLDINPSLLSGNGKTVDQAAHDIWESNFGIDSTTTTEDIRDIIIDILSSGSKANYQSQLATSGEMARLKEELRDLKADLSELQKGKPKIKTRKPIPGQLDLFTEEDEPWEDKDNDDTCVPF